MRMSEVISIVAGMVSGAVWALVALFVYLVVRQKIQERRDRQMGSEEEVK